jgi:hypothetical protein
MKKPKVSFNPAAIGAFFVNHGEKVAFTAVGAFALLLAWWGIDAIRTQAVKPDRKPDAVASLASQATTNIGNVRKVPAERLPSRDPLPPVIDPWRPQQVKITAAPSSATLLDRPLFTELSKRTKPDVFAIEDLRSVAGVAVLPDPAAQVGGPEFAPRQPDLTPPPQEDPRRRTPRGRQPRGRETAGEGRSSRSADRGDQSGHCRAPAAGQDHPVHRRDRPDPHPEAAAGVRTAVRVGEFP